ncbi:WUSCHEL-related homeobox 11-like [Benincasa hispida]|uniref:WUSCHEL-related homeobox 11-like n=1 Tax=Benincasa hispida TaxID=102211 RepID=UPI0019029977|nr:WUSCHEL-related homeobox 11-like [Benincasa hispida]
MENHGDDPNSPNHSCERAEPVRSRWTPKPEQILILESIFNSGMVNPPKDETVRIRKLLEKFGSVGDANVFYWFQNRRSRSRRRQRQLQAAASSGGAIHYDGSSVSTGGGYNSGVMNFGGASSSYLGGGSSSSSSSTSGVGGDCSGGGFSMSGPMGFSEVDQQMVVTTPSFCPSETSNLEFQSGYIIIFINGVPTEVPKGPMDMKAMFGQETVLVHSSGLPVLTNEFGISLHTLQHGESYFLVSRPT